MEGYIKNLTASLWNFNSSIYGESPLANDFPNDLSEHINTRTLPNSRVQSPTGISYRRYKEFTSQRHNGPIYPTQFYKSYPIEG